MTDSPTNSEWRVLVVGKDQNLKSSAGNFLLEDSKFDPNNSNKRCQVEHSVINGQKIVVINTPNILGQSMTKSDLETELQRLYFQASPGPHVMLYVSAQYETDIDKVELDRIKGIFGEEIVSRIIFTFSDYGKISDFSSGIRRSRLFQRHFCLATEDHTALRTVIQEVITKHGNTHFENETFREAEQHFQKYTKDLLSKTMMGRELDILRRELQEMKSQRQNDQQKIDELEDKVKHATEASDREEAAIRGRERDRLIDNEVVRGILGGVAYIAQRLVVHGIYNMVRTYFGF